MKLFLTLLYDSFLETIDRKVLYVEMAIAALVILVAAGIGFEPTPLEEVVARKWGRVDRITYESLTGSTSHVVAPILEVEGVERPDGGRYEANVRVPRPGDARRLVRALVHNRRLSAGEDVRPGQDASAIDFEAALAPEEAEALFRELAGRDLFGFRSVERKGADRFRVTLEPPHPHEVAGAGRISILFGWRSFDLGEASFANVQLAVQSQLATNLAGWYGILVAIIVTSGFFPNLLQEGSADLLLSKPVGRLSVFAAKYLGGLLFVLVDATVLIGGVWLAMSIRSGFWNFGFLATILDVTLLFAVLYAISVFWAVTTRSQILSILMSIGFWAVSGIVQLGVSAVLQFRQSGQDIPDWVVQGMKALYYVVPNTGAFHMLGIYSVSRAPVSDAARERFLASSGYTASMHGLSLGWSFASTAGFTLLVLSLAAWRFRNRDF